MAGPSILYRNILEIAQNGRGSGEIIAYGAGATPDKQNRQFDLSPSSGVYPIVIDEWTEAADFCKGMILKFLDSGREYLITAYQEESYTDIVTVYGTPNELDTGAWEIRRALWSAQFDADYPPFQMTNGNLDDKWTPAVLGDSDIIAFMPNGIDDGGFETGLDPNDSTYPGPWEFDAGGGNGAAELMNVSSSAFLGGYYIRLSQTTGGSILSQPINIPLRKGRTYGILFKASSNSGTTNYLNVLLRWLNFTSATDPTIGNTFTKINANDIIQNSGTYWTNNWWRPEITATEAWQEVYFTVPGDVEAGMAELYLNLYYNQSVDVNIDEVWIGEVIQPDTFILSGHNFPGRFAGGSYIQALRCAPELTGFSGADDASTILDLDASSRGAGQDTIRTTFTAPTAIFSAYRIYLDYGTSTEKWQVAEMWLGESWSWDRFVQDEWEPHDGEVEVQSAQTWGGAEFIAERYRARLISGTIPYIDNAAFQEWLKFIEFAGGGAPFWYYMEGLSWLGSDDELMLMRCAERPEIKAASRRLRASFSFKEVL